VAQIGENPQHQGDDQPTHFVVELPVGDTVHYVICERLVSAEAGHSSLPNSVLADFLNRNPLRAAAIPDSSPSGAKPVWLAQAMVGQSGTGP